MDIVKSEIPLDPLFPFSLRQYILKKEENSAGTFHYHDCFEITCILSGEAKYYVNNAVYDVCPGDILLFNSIEPHGWEVSTEEAVLLVMVFESSLIANGFSALDYDYLMPFVERGSGFQNVLRAKEPEAAAIRALFSEIREESLACGTGCRLMIKADVLRILTLLIRHFQSAGRTGREIGRQALEISRLAAVFDYINSHFSEPLRLRDAAGMAYMSPNYFSAYFRRVTGQTFSEYLTVLRLRRVQELRAHTGRSVTQAAMDCGFRNMSNYYHLNQKYRSKS
jgi:AraC-like DNA-binding protein/quercetin dioxygenase-like cupin family protein